MEVYPLDQCYNCENKVNCLQAWVFYSCRHFVCDACQDWWLQDCRCGEGTYVQGLSLQENEELMNFFAWIDYARENAPEAYNEKCENLHTFLSTYISQSSLTAETAVDNYQNYYWQCPKCQYQNTSENIQCLSCCNYTNLALVPDDFDDSSPKPANVSQQVFPTVTNLWTCSCTYEYNQLTDTRCGKCSKPRPAEHRPQSMVASEAAGGRAAQEDNPNNPCWTCRHCTYEYTMKDTDNCGRCKKPRVEKQPEVPKVQSLPVSGNSEPASAWEYQPMGTMKAGNPPQQASKRQIEDGRIDDVLSSASDKSKTWKCDECSYATNQTSQENCSRCRKPRINPLQRPSPQRGSKQWTCACGRENNETAEVCSHCFTYRDEESERKSLGKPEKAAEREESSPIPILIQAASSKNASLPAQIERKEGNEEEKDESQTWVCKGCSMEGRKGEKCSVCGAGKPPDSPPKSELWVCPGCNSENRGSKCSVCESQKVKPALPATVNVALAPPKTVAKVEGQRNELEEVGGSRKGNEAGKSKEATKKIAPSQLPPPAREIAGKWKCEKCGFAGNVFAMTKCFKCSKKGGSNPSKKK